MYIILYINLDETRYGAPMATKTHRGTDRHGRDVWLFRAYGARSETFHGDADAADKALGTYARRVDAREVAKPGSEKLAELFEEWYETKSWKSVGAKKQARWSLDCYLIPHLGPLRANRFNEDHITKLYTGLQTSGSKSLAKRKQALAPRTLVRLHADLHLFCVWAVKKRHLAYNPADTKRIDIPAISKTTVRAPEPEDVVAVLEEAGVRVTRGRRMAHNPEFAAYLRLLATTGRRREDGLAIQVRDVILREQAVVFDKRAVDGMKGEGVIIEQFDKNNRAARLAVDDVTFAGLLAQIERMKERAAAVKTTLPRTAFLFSDDIDGALPWSPNATSVKMRAVTDRLGLKGLTLHTLRHGVITTLLEEGMDVGDVAQQVGDDPETIWRVYYHFRRVRDRRAAAIMARAIDGGERELVLLEGGG